MEQASKKPRHSRWAWAGLAMVALVIVAAVALFLTRGGSGEEATAASGAAASTSDQTDSQAGAPRVSDAASLALGQVRRESDEPLLDGGKPSVFFMGAEWCPFCA